MSGGAGSADGTARPQSTPAEEKVEDMHATSNLIVCMHASSVVTGSTILARGSCPLELTACLQDREDAKSTNHFLFVPWNEEGYIAYKCLAVLILVAQV